MARKSNQPQIACEFFPWRLFQRDGVFYADGRHTKSHLGKYSLGTRNRDQAIANLRLLDRQKAVELGLASPSTPEPGSKVTLEAGWEAYLTHCSRPLVLGGTSPGTVKRYKAVRDKHLQFCKKNGIQFWSDVTKKSVESYCVLLKKQSYAYRTMFFELTLIKSIILWLIKERNLPADNRVILELPKPQGSDTYCYRPEEVRAMVEHCRSRPTLRWLATVIVALACTGLRISELASLRWTDIDLRSGALRLTDERASSRRRKIGSARTTKGRRDRVLPLHDDLRAELSAMNRSADGRVFHGPRGGKLKPDTVRRILVVDVINPLRERFPTPADEIGFEHGRLHSLRHYFCSQASEHASEAQLIDWLGVRESKIVAHYRHLRDEVGAKKMQQIDFLGQHDRAERSSN